MGGGAGPGDAPGATAKGAGAQQERRRREQRREEVRPAREEVLQGLRGDGTLDRLREGVQRGLEETGALEKILEGALMGSSALQQALAQVGRGGRVDDRQAAEAVMREVMEDVFQEVHKGVWEMLGVGVQTGQEIERAIDEAYRKCMKAKLGIK